MKKTVFLSAVLIILALMLTGCEKPEPPAPPAVFYTLTTIINGKGSVVRDKLSGIIPGSSITIKITPEVGYSIYSVKINGVKVEDIQPSAIEISYAIQNVNKNQYIEVAFVLNDILLLSKLEPALMWTRLDIYRADNDLFISSVNLTKEEKSRKYYHYYPSMDIEVINSDGSIFWKNKWDLTQANYKKGDQILTPLEISDTKFKTKASPIWSSADNCYAYAVYTYERKTN